MFCTFALTGVVCLQLYLLCTHEPMWGKCVGEWEGEGLLAFIFLIAMHWSGVRWTHPYTHPFELPTKTTYKISFARVHGCMHPGQGSSPRQMVAIDCTVAMAIADTASCRGRHLGRCPEQCCASRKTSLSGEVFLWWLPGEGTIPVSRSSPVPFPHVWHNKRSPIFLFQGFHFQKRHLQNLILQLCWFLEGYGLIKFVYLLLIVKTT